MTSERLRKLACALLIASGSIPARAQSLSPHDVTTYPVVYRVPAMSTVSVKKDLTWGTGPKGSLRADLYLPPKSGPVPVVVFVNGVGGPLKEWEIYKTW